MVFLHKNTNTTIMKRFSVIIYAIFAISSIIAQNDNADSIDIRHLDEIVVKGDKMHIKAQDGVIIVDLPAIVKDKPATNILEALAYLPGLVNNNGTITLNGTSSLSLIVNGEPTTMPLQNLYQLLYSTPIDRLKKVEIMYSAPAKYHVDGALINIVMKKPEPLEGLIGQATLEYNNSHFATYSGGLNATYAATDWSIDLGWSLSRTHTYNRQETLSNHLVNDIKHILDDDMTQIAENWFNLIHAAISIKKMKFSYNGQISSDIRNHSFSTGTFGNYHNLYSGLSPSSYHNIAIRYTSPFGLSAGADYTNYSEYKSQNLFKGEEELIYSLNRQKINRYHAYIDIEHTLRDWTIGYGLEYQHSDDKSRQTYIFPPRQGFDNKLREDVLSTYISTESSFQWGLSFNASIKAEYFHNRYNHKWNIIPQIGATFYETPKSIFQLNFTSSRCYPSFWELHGGTAYINDYSMILGNPALQPYINYTGQISYIFRQKYAATFYMLYVDDYFVQLPYQSSTDLHLIFQTLNMDYSQTIGLQLYVPFHATNILNSSATINISHAHQKSEHFHDLNFNNKRWRFSATLNNTIKFTPSCPISLSIDGSFIAGQIQGPGYFDPLWKIDAGAKWQFGKKRCCELAINASDIFNTCNPKLRIKFATQDYTMKSHSMNRNLKLTFTYRFNGFKPKDGTHIDTSRFGTGN